MTAVSPPIVPARSARGRWRGRLRRFLARVASAVGAAHTAGVPF